MVDFSMIVLLTLQISTYNILLNTQMPVSNLHMDDQENTGCNTSNELMYPWKKLKVLQLQWSTVILPCLYQCTEFSSYFREQYIQLPCVKKSILDIHTFTWYFSDLAAMIRYVRVILNYYLQQNQSSFIVHVIFQTKKERNLKQM